MRWTEIRKIHPFLPTKNTGWHQHKNGKGWVEDTATVENSATITVSALVYGEAQVFGEARVSGKARVYGEALVYGEAQVFGEARVYGEARVEDTPLQLIGLTYVANENGVQVRIGCISLPPNKWQKKGNTFAKDNNISDFEADIYNRFIEMVKKKHKLSS